MVSSSTNRPVAAPPSGWQEPGGTPPAVNPARSAAELLQVIDHLPAAVCFVDAQRRYRYHNRRFAELLDRDPGTIDGCTLEEVLGPATLASVAGAVERALAGLETTYEREDRARDGTCRTLAVALIPCTDERGTVTGYYSLLHDVTDVKRTADVLRRQNDELREANRMFRQARDQLLQAERMASIGQLAAGVAHEINNPIGYVNSNLETLQRYLADIFALLAGYEALVDDGDTPERRRALHEARAAADLDFVRADAVALLAESREGISRVRRIVQDLRSFSHSAVDEPWQWADLREGLESTLNIVWNEIKYKARVVREFAAVPPVQCRPGRLNQVFMNLLLNAVQAIRSNGTIHLRIGAERDHVWVEIGDDGAGIDPEHIGRIFDPFFTTKPVGEGTGLGLSLSYGIVQEHRGRIDVRSEVGAGSTFRVWLPIAQGAVPRAPDDAAAPEAPQAAGGPGSATAPEVSR